MKKKIPASPKNCRNTLPILSFNTPSEHRSVGASVARVWFWPQDTGDDSEIGELHLLCIITGRAA